MKAFVLLTLALVLAACEAEAPEIDTLAPGNGSDPAADLVPRDDVRALAAPLVRADAASIGDGATAADGTADLAADSSDVAAPKVAAPTGPGAASSEGPRVRAILPDGRVVMLGADDLMPGRFTARSERFRVKVAFWAGE